jgi:TonB family protein
MLKPVSLYLVLSLLFCGTVSAQSGQTIYHPGIFFMKNDGRYVNSRDSADFIRLISAPDSGSTLYNVMDVYKNNKRRLVGKSTKSNIFSPEGQCVGFYPNGNRKFMENYVSGKLNGLSYYFYPNGKIYNIKEYVPNNGSGNEVLGGGGLSFSYLIKDCADSTGKVLAKDGNGRFIGYDNDFRYIEEEGPVKNGKMDSTWTGRDAGLKIKFTEQYADGKLLSGSSTDSAGMTHTYSQRRVLPQYRGGETAIYRYLGSHIIYPSAARENNIQGTVILSFIVKKDGKIKDIKILKSVDKDLDEEAARVVKNMNNWQAGMFYGVPVNISYSLPVTFALR